MSNSVRGVVRNISGKPFGNKTLYSVQLEGDKAYYGAGERHPPMESGKAYEFDVNTTPKGYMNIVPDSIRAWEGGPVMEKTAANTFQQYAKKPFVKDAAKDEYWANKEKRDIRNDSLRELGATRNTAIAFIELLVKTESLKLPANQAKREEVLWEALNKYTSDFMKGESAPATSASEEVVSSTDSQSDGW